VRVEWRLAVSFCRCWSHLVLGLREKAQFSLRHSGILTNKRLTEADGASESAAAAAGGAALDADWRDEALLDAAADDFASASGISSPKSTHDMENARAENCTRSHTRTQRERKKGREQAHCLRVYLRPLSCLLSRKGKNAAAALTNCPFLGLGESAFVPRTLDTISAQKERRIEKSIIPNLKDFYS
jgi:hypothetical protein